MEGILRRIEELQTSTDKFDENNIYMKEQLTEIDKDNAIKIDFNECHVAMAPNGGLIAICKKKGFIDMEKNSKINDNIIISFQDLKKKFLIPYPNTWKNERWPILFDFNKNEKLYGICDDGTIYKFDLLTLKAEEKVSSQKFKEDKILKAQLVSNGFVALTKNGNFYYIKNIKEPNANLLFSLDDTLKFSNDIEFLCIPESNTKSGSLEILLTNEKGGGVIHILPKNKKKPEISMIIDNSLEPYSEEKNKNNEGTIGKICALAISPTGEQIAIYNNKGIAYCFPSTLDKPKKKVEFEINSNSLETEIHEQQAIIKFIEDDDEKNKSNKKRLYQFLFCGENALAISGQRFILISNIDNSVKAKSSHKINNNKTLVYKITNQGALDTIFGISFSKCFSEIDGLRYITYEGVFLISQISKNFNDFIDLFKDSIEKKVLRTYINFIEKKPYSDKEIREIHKDLPSGIENLQLIAANIYFLENSNINDNKTKKQIQLLLLKAAQYGKTFVQKEEFNFEKFIKVCKEIRIVNNLRNHPWQPRFITYNEYKHMNNLIKKLMTMQNYSMAFKMCQYLNYDVEPIYEKFTISNIKKFPSTSTLEQEIKLYKNLYEKIKNFKNISYIKIAQKAFKYDKNEIGMKFLQHEKSSLKKLPQYIEHCKWEKALELAYETLDSNIINTVIDKMMKFESGKEFVNVINKYPQIQLIVIDYIKKNCNNLTIENNPDGITLENFLKNSKDQEELFFYYLEKYFSGTSLEEKKNAVKKCKWILENTPIQNDTFDNKFYTNYIRDLENSITLKIEFMDKKLNIIKQSDNSNFDNSIYDVFAMGVDKFDIIESKNKKLFELDLKKLSLMRINTLAKNGKAVEIDKIIQKYSLKKLGISAMNVADIFYQNKNYDKAAEYIKKVTDSKMFEYKVDMLKCMDKYADALEVVIMEQDNEKMPFLLNEIISKRPDLKPKAEELCEKYGVMIQK